MFEIKGLDQLQRRLKDLERRSQSLDGTHELSFAELFPDSFMRQHTQFATMQEMIDVGNIENGDDIHKPEWCAFVAAHTNFDSWESMKSVAGQEWAKRKLGLSR
ncbi:MAG: hypothetical protein IT203_09530 [Fimbriimonadaceae bacterium]|nr:hypothetical protein [Fimbriimonadaceae bacterium]